MSPDGEVRVDVGGRTLRLRRLDKVLYPETGTTKGEVLDYYARVSPLLLPHLARRPVTRKRWPDGVSGPSFFEKNLPRGTPDWVSSVTLPTPGSSSGHDDASYPLVLDLATLVWLANLAALELHVPQWQVGPRGAVKGPDRLVIDLDPGPPAGLAECAAVALMVRERLVADGLSPVPVTSGSKGMQLYAPLDGRSDFVIFQTTSSGSARVRSCAISRARSRISSAPWSPGSAAYSCMPLLPLVTGALARPIPVRRSRTARARRAHSCSPAGLPGSRSITSRSGDRGRPSSSTRHCGTCSSSEARLAR